MIATVVVLDAKRDTAECLSSFVDLSFILVNPEEFLSTACFAQETIQEHKLRIAPDNPVVVGRCDTPGVPYLDTHFLPTSTIPGTGQSILISGGCGRDSRVSRAHLMLRAAAGGVLLINGVPKRGGGIRPPMNGTFLLVPVQRMLSPAEKYLVERNVETIIALPNGLRVKIAAR